MTTRELEHFIYLVTRIIRPTIRVAVVKIKKDGPFREVVRVGRHITWYVI